MAYYVRNMDFRPDIKLEDGAGSVKDTRCAAVKVLRALVAVNRLEHVRQFGEPQGEAGLQATRLCRYSRIRSHKRLFC